MIVSFCCLVLRSRLCSNFWLFLIRYGCTVNLSRTTSLKYLPLHTDSQYGSIYARSLWCFHGWGQIKLLLHCSKTPINTSPNVVLICKIKNCWLTTFTVDHLNIVDRWPWYCSLPISRKLIYAAYDGPVVTWTCLMWISNSIQFNRVYSWLERLLNLLTRNEKPKKNFI